jgi:hypothetical protein
MGWVSGGKLPGFQVSDATLLLKQQQLHTAAVQLFSWQQAARLPNENSAGQQCCCSGSYSSNTAAQPLAELCLVACSIEALRRGSVTHIKPWLAPNCCCQLFTQSATGAAVSGCPLASSI